METILLVEDDVDLRRGMTMALSAPERVLETAATAAEAQTLLAQSAADLLILDINLPDGSGLDILRRLRGAGRDVPVILLTANDLEMDEVVGLEAGANDYITKPFSLAVLRARVAVQLRTAAQAKAKDVVVLAPFVFDFSAMVFSMNGEALSFSKTEQKVLRLLVENRGHTVPRETLLNRVWEDGAAYVDENALSVTIKRLRNKLERDPAHPRYLKTVYGLGYTWAVEA